ncbi:MAG TPA: hypothetical protein VF043_23840 [Ktedonobacteraceae bacterium]
MHPFLNQQMGDFHRTHLLHEAEIERSSEQAYRDVQENKDVYWYRRDFWSRALGLPNRYSSVDPAQLKQTIMPVWVQRRLPATIRTIGFSAFGVGMLAGSFLGSRFGLLPAVLLACIVCLTISIPVVGRLLHFVSM